MATLEPFIQLDNPVYLLNLISHLEQQALFVVQQKFTDLLGRRVQLKVIDDTQLESIAFASPDIVVSNIPLDAVPVQVIYISRFKQNEADPKTPNE